MGRSRCAIVVRAGRVHLWSQQGTDLSDRFPDIRAAVTDQVPHDAVLEGELVVRGDGRFNARKASIDDLPAAFLPSN